MQSEELYHYGTPRHSGRYPWGSGKDPYQHEEFYKRVQSMEDQGMSQKDIIEALNKGLPENEQIKSTGELRRRYANAKNQFKADQINKARRLSEKGYSNVAIAKELGVREGTIRNYLKPDYDKKIREQQQTTNILKDMVAKNKYVDVGVGVEKYMNVTEESLLTSLQQLQDEGYQVRNFYIDQLGTKFKTTVRVLCPPGTTKEDAAAIYKDPRLIAPVQNYVSDDGKSVLGLKHPTSISSDRVYIKYTEDGGGAKDGIIELRKGVDDISLGESQYAQVRIAVDDKYYLKGVAMYSDKIPEGYDIIFNTSKHEGTPVEKVFKPLKTTSKDPDAPVDWDNPFGSQIKKSETIHDSASGKDLLTGGQREYVDKDGNVKLSAINKVNDEGDWDKWSKTLSAQFLSKQSTQLIKSQLEYTLDGKRAELEDIKSLTNPTVKKQQLEAFAEDCDASAVHLKADSLPRQSSKVILPLSTLKDDEIYAPTYNNGEKVALVRYPHGGIFEIPILTVNNNNKEGRSVLKNVQDAVGIGPKAAAQLSGADFDGDTVLVIPTGNGRVSITASKAIKDLVDFEPKEAYAEVPGMKYMGKKNKQTEMGKATNLIADMGFKGANEDEIVRAVKYSMVVIDSEKHKLNYKQAYDDFRIKDLKLLYQGVEDPVTGKIKTGAGTLITRSKSQERVNERIDYATKVDPITGEKIYKYSGNTYEEIKKNPDGTYTNTGVIKNRQTLSSKMAEVDDARKLMSTYGTPDYGVKDNPKEVLYADYANSLKAMANAARKEALSINDTTYSKSAAKAYAKEVESLDNKLNTALMNAPRERYAQIYANGVVKAKIADNPTLKDDDDQMKKVRTSALNAARSKFGASKEKINITDDEWKAIQAGAVTKSKLEKILLNADSDRVKELSMPKNNKKLTNGQILQAKAMLENGRYTYAEVADLLNVSTSTISNYVNG